MSCKRWIPILIVFIAFSTTFAVYSKTPLKEGQKAPIFTLPRIGGGELALSRVIKDNKLTLVNFWATTCEPCVAEMPDLISLYAKYHAAGLELLSVDCGEDPQLVKDFVAKQGMDFPVLLDNRGVVDRYGVDGIPTTIGIDGKGTIKLIYIGMLDLPKFEATIRSILGETAANVRDTTAASFAVGNLFACYPLIGNANDITGGNLPMTLTNTPFQDGGIYCDGQYQESEAQTPQINKFNFNAFTIIARFKVSELPTASTPVFVGGSLYRWMAFYLEPDGTVTLHYNNFEYVPSQIRYKLNTWHEAAITYQDRTAALYLDGIQAANATFNIEHGGDSDISLSDYSNGHTFKGIFGALRIYSK